jgi:DNA-binding response OmpR family regulator
VKTDNGFQDLKILIIDDEFDTLDMVETYFIRKGYEVQTSLDGQEGLRAFFAGRPDLIILDIMMPGLDGFKVCQRIRELSDVPIIMLTALGQNDDIIRALEAGADDYVTKPFSLDVLLARVRAVLRRGANMAEPAAEPVIYDDGFLTIDVAQRRILVGGEPVKLSMTEYRLLTYLLQHANQPLTSRQILAEVWGEGYEGNHEYLHAYIWQLRQKLEKNPAKPTYLLTEHGLGYRFEKKKVAES